MVSEILELVTNMQDVAMSSRVLAINARIEASHAGEAGRGFAVVAGTMQELSQQVVKANEAIRALSSQIETLLPTMHESAASTASECEQQTERVNQTVNATKEKYRTAEQKVVSTLEVNRKRGESFRMLSGALLERIQFSDLVNQRLHAALVEAKRPQQHIEALLEHLSGSPTLSADELDEFWKQCQQRWAGTVEKSPQRDFAMDMLTTDADEGDAGEKPLEEGSVVLF
jgi:hypothetical protein